MDADLLESSLALVTDDEHTLTVRFYEILFGRHPELRPMFSADVGPQARMLSEALGAVVAHLDDAEWLGRTLGALGARHAGWGVTAPMYDAVAGCMLTALEECGGSAWTPEMTTTWSAALGTVASLMLAGAAAEASLAG
jgi:hemoglobin-like flavoprotein